MVNIYNKISSYNDHQKKVDKRWEFTNGVLQAAGTIGLSIFSNYINTDHSNYDETETKTDENEIDLTDNTKVEEALDKILKDKNIKVPKNSKEYSRLKKSYINNKTIHKDWTDSQIENSVYEAAKTLALMDDNSNIQMKDKDVNFFRDIESLGTKFGL